MADHPLAAILSAIRPLAEEPDRCVLSRFASTRDEAAFAELVRRHGPTVWAVCRRALADPNDAEDAFQIAFLSLARDAGSVGQSVGGWLYRVSRRTVSNLSRDAGRRRRREAAAAIRPSDEPSPGPGDGLEAELDRLPARYRDPLVLCHVAGLSVREAATQLGCPEGTVKTLLSRGRALLKRRLEARGLAFPTAALAVTVPVALAARTVRAAAEGVVPESLSSFAVPLTGGWTMKAVLGTLGLALAVAAVGGVSGYRADATGSDARETKLGSAVQTEERVRIRGKITSFEDDHPADPLSPRHVWLEGEKAGDTTASGEIAIALPPSARTTRVDGSPGAISDLRTGDRIEIEFPQAAADAAGRTDTPWKVPMTVRLLADNPKALRIRGTVVLMRDVKGKGIALLVDPSHVDGDNRKGPFLIYVTKEVKVVAVHGEGKESEMAAAGLKHSDIVELELGPDGLSGDDLPVGIAKKVWLMSAPPKPRATKAPADTPPVERKAKVERGAIAEVMPALIDYPVGGTPPPELLQGFIQLDRSSLPDVLRSPRVLPSVLVDSRTKITDATRGKEVPAKFGDLKAGARVEVRVRDNTVVPVMYVADFIRLVPAE